MPIFIFLKNPNFKMSILLSLLLLWWGTRRWYDTILSCTQLINIATQHYTLFKTFPTSFSMMCICFEYLNKCFNILFIYIHTKLIHLHAFMCSFPTYSSIYISILLLVHKKGILCRKFRNRKKERWLSYIDNKEYVANNHNHYSN